MPNKNEPNKPQPAPRPGSGTGAKPGSVTKPGSGPSKGVVTPQDNDQPPQNRKVAGTAAALLAGFIDALIGIPRPV
jgi:hypothetical protein